MNYNTIIIITGIIVIIVALCILLRQKNNTYSKEVLPSLSLSERDLKKLKVLLEEGQGKLREEIHVLTNEVSTLKKYIASMSECREKSEKSHSEPFQEDPQQEGFNHSLNYNKFVEKNKDIIDVYKENNNLEETAKILNKSIREVEMVIKLVK
ncbi:hypothetical protein CACET_c20030 [Clostridium aceticum]|uniref:Uncharacterized protein n=1 Tax=Clostridium aceticum TaxID=84022 RepID=A0A0D8I7A8_9CLOT|nr:hypothetical protein [Clostridium aceticum]AKL95451.1 hypothetical protein CACET_c20030 [Clostridium aceticum]KJF25939.1 hypothetical protein TZ02_15600 [Clostridium aceticum]